MRGRGEGAAGAESWHYMKSAGLRSEQTRHGDLEETSLWGFTRGQEAALATPQDSGLGMKKLGLLVPL